MELFAIYSWVVQGLIYLALLIHFITRKNNDARIQLAIAFIGFTLLSIAFEGEFFIAQTFFIVWMLVVNMPLMISRMTAFILLVAALIISVTSPAFYFLSLTLYVIVIGGFIFSAFGKVGKAVASLPP